MIPLVDLKAQYQTIKTDIDTAVQRVIDSAYFVMGPEVTHFEQKWANFCQIPHAIGVASGTAAPHLVLAALNIGQGHEVITTTHTFIATAESIRHAGATPVLVDIDPRTYNINPQQIEAAITPHTRAIMPVHLYGQPAAMDAIQAIAKKHNLHIIEDAAQAHAATYAGKPIGQWGDAATFSFYPGKNLGAYGDAGAVITANQALAEKISMIRNHGRTQKYVHDLHGYGERLDAMQAAVLSVKIDHLAAWTAARRQVAQHYRQQLADLPLILPYEDPQAKHVYHLFVIQLENQKTRDHLLDHLKNNGIGASIHYPVPLHLQPALDHLGYMQGAFPHCEHAANTILSLPIFPELSKQHQQTIIQTVQSFFH